MISGRAMENQQVDLTIVIVFTVHIVIAGAKSSLAGHHGFYGLIRKVHHGKFSGQFVTVPFTVEGIKAVLTEAVLHTVPVSIVFYTGNLHIGISPVRVDIGMDILYPGGLHDPGLCGYQLAVVIVAVDLQPQDFKGIQIEDAHIVLPPIGGGQRIGPVTTEVAILLLDSRYIVDVFIVGSFLTIRKISNTDQCQERSHGTADGR